MDMSNDHPDEADALTQLYLRDLGEARRRKVWLGTAVIVLLFACAAAIAAVLLAPQIGRIVETAAIAVATDPAPAPGPAPAQAPETLPQPPKATGDPVSILPKEPAGTTIIVKQPEAPAATQPEAKPADLPAAPVASGSQMGSGYSMDLGAALSFTELSRRFGEIARANQEIPFDALEPRATLKDTAQGLEARLVVGPFATEAEARQTCEQIALPAGIECRPAPFEGELISRQ
jgi:hypothetical protein